MHSPIAYTIPDAVRVSGISRTAIYDALKSGKLLAVKRGKRTLIPYASLSGYLASLPTYKAGA
jgi:excisionase family DNA binding protein